MWVFEEPVSKLYISAEKWCFVLWVLCFSHEPVEFISSWMKLTESEISLKTRDVLTLTLGYSTYSSCESRGGLGYKIKSQPWVWHKRLYPVHSYSLQGPSQIHNYSYYYWCGPSSHEGHVYSVPLSTVGHPLTCYCLSFWIIKILHIVCRLYKQFQVTFAGLNSNWHFLVENNWLVVLYLLFWWYGLVVDARYRALPKASHRACTLVVCCCVGWLCGLIV